MKVKTSELEGVALDWAVAEVVGEVVSIVPPDHILETPALLFMDNQWDHLNRCQPWNPSTDWSQGGPLIDQYIGEFIRNPRCKPWARTSEESGLGFANGPTILIAACRAIVASKLGETVEIPEELL